MGEVRKLGPARRLSDGMTTKSVLPSRPAGSVPIKNQAFSRPEKTPPAPKPAAAVSKPSVVVPPPAVATHSRVESHQEATTAGSELSDVLAKLSSTADFMQDMKRAAFQKKETSSPTRSTQPWRREAKLEAIKKPAPESIDDSSSPTTFQSTVAAHLSALESITSGLASKLSRFQPGEVILSKLCTRFSVAALTSGSSSAVKFFGDRTEYNFVNDKVGNVKMIMYHRDTKDVRVSKTSRTVSFHVFNPLECFADHYNHKDAGHRISIQFPTRADLAEVERVAVPLLQRGAGEA